MRVIAAGGGGGGYEPEGSVEGSLDDSLEGSLEGSLDDSPEGSLGLGPQELMVIMIMAMDLVAAFGSTSRWNVSGKIESSPLYE